MEKQSRTKKKPESEKIVDDETHQNILCPPRDARAESGRKFSRDKRLSRSTQLGQIEPL